MHTKPQNANASRLEVMRNLEPFVAERWPKLLRPTDELWQPSDFIPDFGADDYVAHVAALREEARGIPDDVLNSLVGDTITEEALPTYSSYIASLEGVGEPGCRRSTPWAAWNRAWSAEENRHGDVLNAYLRLSGRVHMREIELTIHHLIHDGMDIGTGADPYRFFVYTSFQELATLRSHRGVARLAEACGAERLSKMSRVIAGDEGWHATAYRLFVSKFLEVDREEALAAIADMFRQKITMPAMNLREGGAAMGATFATFEIVAQRAGVYTSLDYVEIMEFLIREWELEGLSGLSPRGAEAQEYVCGLPARYRRMLDRTTSRRSIETGAARFRWMR